MKATRRQGLLLALGSTVVSLAMGEVVTRLFLPHPVRADRTAIVQSKEIHKTANRQTFQSLHQEDPLIGWVLNPKSFEHRHRLVDKEDVVQYDVLYSVDSGHRRTSAAPGRGPEVITAGCSFTFGHGLNDEDSWPWQLQEKLPGYRVVNTADIGYGTDQALLTAEREIHQHPGQVSVVVLGFGDFQIERNRSPQGWMVTVYPYAKPLFAVRGSDVVYQRQVRFMATGIAGDYSSLIALGANAFGNRVYGVPSHEGAKVLTAALITSYAKRFQAAGVRLAVVLLPYNGDDSPLSRADRNYIIQQLQAAHVPTLQAEIPHKADGAFDVAGYMVSKIDRHPNRLYNSALVKQVVPFLQSAGLVTEQTAYQR